MNFKVFLCLFLFLLSSKCFSEEVFSYEDAVSLAGKTDKKIVLIFGAEWCGYCRDMKKVLKEESVLKEINSNFILFKVDTDKEPKIKKSFNVKSIPECIILDKEEKVLKRSKGYKDVDSFLLWIGN